MDPPESQNSRDARIEKLWLQLDPEKKGEIDIHDLQKGLSRIDHPLQNATDMLKEVMKAMDKNGDKYIQYEEFRTFVEETEKGLLSIFMDIDKDHNGKVDKEDLKTAFKKSGLTVPDWKFEQFFSEIDKNHDGYIEFSEWRNFLLFIPTHAEQPLKAALSYFSATLKLNAEGDTSINEDTLEGLGTAPSLISQLFGVIFQLSQLKMDPSTTTTPTSTDPPKSPTSEDGGAQVEENNTPQPQASEASETSSVPEAQQAPDPNPSVASNTQHVPDPNASVAPNAQQVPEAPATLDASNELPNFKTQEHISAQRSWIIIILNIKLTDFLPHAGYFAAGAVAGVISRTATAPLDRLKVYLIANIGSASGGLDAAKKGDAIIAARRLGQPLVDAMKDLWRAGGIRSLFAGNGLNVIKVMPESAIKFGSYEMAKKFFARMEGLEDSHKISGFSKFFAGGIGGMISQLFVYPLDTLKFRMQCETVKGGLHGNQLILATAKKMVQEGAFKTSYRGLTMGLVGMFPYSAIDLGTFEFLKARLIKHNARIMGCSERDALPGAFATGCIGAFSGAFGASLVYPINLLRTRLQAQGTVMHPPTYTGVWDVLQKTMQREGVKGLFKGITPNLIKVVPAVSITYVSYEHTKKVLKLT